MSLTAAARGLFVFLLSVPVIQGQVWGVTYTSKQICAVKGSTVDIPCTYTYPSTVTAVTKSFWHLGNDVDLKGVLVYKDRVQYNCGNNKNCTLSISDLRERDSVEYQFRFITNQEGGRYTGKPGVKLSVTALQMQVNEVTFNQSVTKAELSCLSSCKSYTWIKNGQKVPGEASSYTAYLNPGDSISCALKGQEIYHTPSLYAPDVSSVSVSPSGDIMEGSSVTLTCSSNANIVANYAWYKKIPNQKEKPLSEGPQLVFISVQSSDSGQYYCTAENKLGRRTSANIFINVKYAPKFASLSVSPSAEIVEGSSVTLTCSSDANPAANYTWYKENQTLPHGPEGVYHFTSISSKDRGNYHCKSENQHGQINSSSLFIDVQYGPKRPSVSVSPSAEIVEGSSVTLTCSSDANPAANYTWYKENEDSPKASGQIFTITNFRRAEHSGNYSCEVQNRRGRQSFTLHLTVRSVLGSHFPGEWISIIAGTVTTILIVVILIAVLLWIRKKRARKQPPEPTERPDKSAQNQTAEPKDNLHYASVNFSKKQADSLYANTIAAPAQKPEREEEVDGVEYSTVKLNSGSTATRNSCQETGVDPAALYSTVYNPHRKHGYQNS